ncbi:hypothetical protein PNOK_0449700 [Pyrrhoderma noxium]|uniref:Uncharacterized protein n=1 Tax=Pyrrhoderma noxium TaxID=2282107 RepID=A0A286UIW3_9AGAM|nr:hypothetical protein PNOK_0449700 [Pyrrhoderma noxium]
MENILKATKDRERMIREGKPLLFPFFFFLSFVSYDVSRRQTYQNPGASFITSSSNLHSDFSCLHSGCHSSSPEHTSKLGFESKSRVRVSESTQQIHDLG